MNVERKHVFIITTVMIVICITSLLIFKKEEPKKIKNKTEETMKVYLLNEDVLVEYNTLTYSENKEDKIKEIIHYMKQEEDGFTALLNKDTQLNKIEIIDKGIHLYFDHLSYEIENERKLLESLIYACTQFNGINFIVLYENDKVLEAMPLNKTPLVYTGRNFGINAFESNNLYLHEGNMKTLYYKKTINNKDYLIPKSIRLLRKDDYNLLLTQLCETNYDYLKLKQPLFDYKVKMKKQCYFEEGNLHLYLNENIIENKKLIKQCEDIIKATFFEDKSINKITVHVDDLKFEINNTK